MKLSSKRIAVLGGGNLGQAIVHGLLKAPDALADNFTVTRRQVQKLKSLAAKGVDVHSDNHKAVGDADIVVLAVKPYQAEQVLAEVKGALEPQRHVLISVVTGVSLQQLQAAVGPDVPVYRAMPNTAIAIQQSMTCIASLKDDPDSQALVEQLFGQLGEALVVEENLMEAATILGACGVAYALRYIRATMQGGIEIGFSSEHALKIASQTVKGAAELLIQNGQHPEFEIDKVTTPQGCTIVGLNEMEHQGFSSSLIRGIKSSFEKLDKK